MAQKTFDFNPEVCKLRHPNGSEAGTCPCEKKTECPKPPRHCARCGDEIDGTPYRRRDPNDHTEVEEVCVTCYQS
jgi:hypothetical protein